MRKQYKVALIEKEHPSLSITKQANLLNISRASIYYVPRVDAEDIAALRALDQVYTKRPFYGSRNMRYALRDDYLPRLGFPIGERMPSGLDFTSVNSLCLTDF